MDGDGRRYPRPFSSDSAGELVELQLVDALCQRWGCLPSEVLAEDADLILRLVRLVIAPGAEGGAAPVASDPLSRLAELQQVMG